MPWFSDRAGPAGGSRIAPRRCCLPPLGQRRRPDCCDFAAQSPGLHVPLPTLRHALAGRRRMTRGRRGSLALRRRALPSPPPCRFIPALSQDRAETRLPVRGLAPLLQPAHRRRARLRHRQGPRQQRHQPRLVPPDGPGTLDAVRHDPAHRPQPAHPARLEHPAGRNPAPRSRRATPENPQTAPQNPRRPRRRATLTRSRRDHEPRARHHQHSSHDQAKARPDTGQIREPDPATAPEDPGTGPQAARRPECQRQT